MRFALAGKGKSGGARVSYYFPSRCDRIYRILVYPKNVKDDLTGSEERELRQLALVLEGEC